MPLPLVYKNSDLWCENTMQTLHASSLSRGLFPADPAALLKASSVLLLLGEHCDPAQISRGPCFIFNKRSSQVKQPGDLCFPGGRINPRLDRFLTGLLKLPFSPLARWPYKTYWRRQRPAENRSLAFLLATSLRESFEEMGLNPFGVRFLGPLASQSLRTFDRIIYPMVGWINRQRHFFPNWEVSKIMYIPLTYFLEPRHYVCCRIHFTSRDNRIQDFTALQYEERAGIELLWGVTFRITLALLEILYGFKPPNKESLPVVYRTLGEEYFTGYKA
jgi:8-oxo-dGTP pyrophosphatase MutT (NUDIX family)